MHKGVSVISLTAQKSHPTEINLDLLDIIKVNDV